MPTFYTGSKLSPFQFNWPYQSLIFHLKLKHVCWFICWLAILWERAFVILLHKITYQGQGLFPQIELVLTLEEQLPECIHEYVMKKIKEDIVVHPNRVNEVLLFPKLALWLGCILCSLVCFNINHARYWGYEYNPATKQDTKYTEVPGLIEKAQSDSFIHEVST